MFQLEVSNNSSRAKIYKIENNLINNLNKIAKPQKQKGTFSMSLSKSSMLILMSTLIVLI